MRLTVETIKLYSLILNRFQDVSLQCPRPTESLSYQDCAPDHEKNTLFRVTYHILLCCDLPSMKGDVSSNIVKKTVSGVTFIDVMNACLIEHDFQNSERIFHGEKGCFLHLISCV
jgi:hypothetical protein